MHTLTGNEKEVTFVTFQSATARLVWETGTRQKPQNTLELLALESRAWDMSNTMQMVSHSGHDRETIHSEYNRKKTNSPALYLIDESAIIWLEDGKPDAIGITKPNLDTGLILAKTAYHRGFGKWINNTAQHRAVSHIDRHFILGTT